MKILIVEDERQISNSIVEYLSQEQYVCEQAFTLKDARIKVMMYEYDCILLDLMLPDGTGLDLLHKVKEKQPNTGVIIVSAKDSVDDKINGLVLGADDYLAKPFHLAELSIRILAVMRRRLKSGSNTLTSGPIEIDLMAKTVHANGNLLDLTRSEYELLIFLIQNKTRVLSRGAIAEHLNGDMADLFDDFNFVYAHVKNLKNKLGQAGVSKKVIRTQYGVGYRWREDEF